MFKLKNFLLLLAIVIVSVEAFAADGRYSKPISEFELGKYQYCGTHTDCVKAVNGCCDCVNGAEDVAINASRVNEFNSLFNCINAKCENLDNKSCGQGLVTCLNHKCHYVDHSKDQTK